MILWFKKFIYKSIYYKKLIIMKFIYSIDFNKKYFINIIYEIYLF